MMLTSIAIILFACYLVLVFVANFGEGQCDFECDLECDLEYSSIPISAGNSQLSWQHSQEAAPLSSSFTIKCCQQTQNQTAA